jgi:hypothetical protein
MVSGGVVRNGGQALLAGEVGCVDQGAERVSSLPGPDNQSELVELRVVTSGGCGSMT